MTDDKSFSLWQRALLLVIRAGMFLAVVAVFVAIDARIQGVPVATMARAMLKAATGL